MSAVFEKVKRFAEEDIPLPERKTADSAGYDLAVAEDTVVPSCATLLNQLDAAVIEMLKTQHPEFAGETIPTINPVALKDVASIVKSANAKPTLVPTGVKCRLDYGTYLEITVRSSTPLKYWLLMANGKGIIDADYYGCEQNDGEIYLQLINLCPFPIQLHKGDIIAQAIIHEYKTTQNDSANGIRAGGFGSTSA